MMRFVIVLMVILLPLALFAAGFHYAFPVVTTPYFNTAKRGVDNLMHTAKATVTENETAATVAGTIIDFPGYVVEGVKVVGVHVAQTIQDQFPMQEQSPHPVETARVTSHDVDVLAGLEPAAGDDEGANPPENFANSDYKYDIEDKVLIAEGVLVPQAKTVIISNQARKIKKIHVANGAKFEKGDMLIEYHCNDIRAEMQAAKAEKTFARERQLTASRLFNLELSSAIEVEQSKVEREQAMAKSLQIESRLQDCAIRADYDGRVLQKLANDNEYIAPNQKVLEVAAQGVMNVEFTLPSRSLRWINVGAPISISISEIDKAYTGKIISLSGKINPEDKTIAVLAALDNKSSLFMPGMSGEVTVDIRDIRQAGIVGYFENAAMN